MVEIMLIYLIGYISAFSLGKANLIVSFGEWNKHHMVFLLFNSLLSWIAVIGEIFIFMIFYDDE